MDVKVIGVVVVIAAAGFLGLSILDSPGEGPVEEESPENVTNAEWCENYAGDNASTITNEDGDACVGPSDSQSIGAGYEGTTGELQQANSIEDSPCSGAETLFCDMNGEENVDPSEDISW